MTPGRIYLLGSGEGSPSIVSILRKLFASHDKLQKISILETPAGFQPNSFVVASDLSKLYKNSLQEFIESVSIVSARAKNTEYSPDNSNILEPLLESNFILLGPGSPTYTVRQLKDSLALKIMLERWKNGATLGFSSAAAIAIGAYTLPVYEIFKVGEDLHWISGLNLFKEFGLDITVIAHWNNTEGGKKLDTSRCYMGEERFSKLLKLLPPDSTILGIDENTVVVIDIQTQSFTVLGNGTMTILKGGDSYVFDSGEFYALSGLNDGIAKKGVVFLQEKKIIKERFEASSIPEDVRELLAKRESARKNRDFAVSDVLRVQIEEKGYVVEDSQDGQHIFLKE